MASGPVDVSVTNGEIKAGVTVVIPTYRRESVLLDTLAYVLALSPAPDEVILIDQTETHEPGTEETLRSLSEAGKVNWQRLQEPSIPKAMNHGLMRATHEVVLFLDDDIRPDPNLIAAHAEVQHGLDDIIVAGRVVQPWHAGVTFPAEEKFHFACIKPQWIEEFMGGNFSIRRATAIALGGFDENFVRVAYRFEAEFAFRFRVSGRKIWYEPKASIDHLKASGGGTRAYGGLLTTMKPDHAVGVYYYCLRTGSTVEFLRRFFRAATTRFHLRHPWYIPVTMIGELRGIAWALRLWSQGPRYVRGPHTMAESRS